MGMGTGYLGSLPIGGYIPSLREIMCLFSSIAMPSQAHRCAAGRPT